MVEVERNFWRQPSPTGPVKEAGCRELRLCRFKMNPLHNVSGQLVTVLGHLQKNPFFLIFSMSSYSSNYISVCAHCPDTDTTGDSLVPSFWHLPLRYLHTLIRSLFSRLFSRLNWARSLSLSLQDMMLQSPSNLDRSPEVPCLS